MIFMFIVFGKNGKLKYGGQMMTEKVLRTRETGTEHTVSTYKVDIRPSKGR